MDLLKNFEFSFREGKIFNIKYMKLTGNIIVIGRPGVGKSNLSNILMNQKVANVDFGFEQVTKTINKYIKEELTILDTPGLDESSMIRNITSLISSLTSKSYLVIYCIKFDRVASIDKETINFLLDIKINLLICITMFDESLIKSEEEEKTKNKEKEEKK